VLPSLGPQLLLKRKKILRIGNGTRRCVDILPFMLHKKIDRKSFDDLLDEYGIRLSPEATPFGVVVGLAECVDVITKKEVTRNTKKWFKGEYGFVLKNVISIKKPVPVKGGLGFWRLKGRALHAVLDQLNSPQVKIIASNTLGIIDKV